MIIYLKGKSDRLARAAIGQLKHKYIEKNPDGAELLEVDVESPIANWSDLRVMPLFATSRLVVVKSISQFSKEAQRDLAGQLSLLPKTTVAVIWDNGEITTELTSALQNAEKVISVELPSSEKELTAFLRNRTKELGREPLEADEYRKLINEHGDNLWSLDSALFGYLAGEVHLERHGKKTVTDQFALFRLVERSSWGEVSKRFIEEYQAGAPIELLIGSIASALRRSRASQEQKKAMVTIVSDLDFGLKTGVIEESDAAALLSSYLSQPALKRVQWEEQWEETI